MTRETLMLRAQSLLPNLPQETLEFACDLVLEQICNYCNLTEAPDGLTNTAALMVRGLVNSVQLQNENMQPAAKGVSRGDTSFSFATAAEQLAALAGSGDFLTDYKAQLNAYRTIIRQSDMVLAVYDPASARGDDTDKAISYARELHCPMLMIHPDTLKIEYACIEV